MGNIPPSAEGVDVPRAEQKGANGKLPEKSFLEQAGQASLFQCGNPDRVRDEDGYNGQTSGEATFAGFRIISPTTAATQVCLQTGDVIDRIQGRREGSDNGLGNPCVNRGSPNTEKLFGGGNGADSDDEFQSLRDLQQKHKSAGGSGDSGDKTGLFSNTRQDMTKENLGAEQAVKPNRHTMDFEEVVRQLSQTGVHPGENPLGKYSVVIGLCLSRRNADMGHPETVSRQTQFDFNELQDRGYKYVSDTDQNGWRAGGGEPGHAYHVKRQSKMGNNSPESPGGRSQRSNQTADDTTVSVGSDKIPRADTSYLPIIQIDAQSEQQVDLIVHALAKGEVFIPHMAILPESLGVNGMTPPDLVVKFGCERDEDAAPEEWPNWCLEFLHNQLYDYFLPLGAKWSKRPFQMTIARKVRWRTVKHMNRYFSQCERVIDNWRESGAQLLSPDAGFIEGGASTEEVAKPHGVYLIRNGIPTNYFAPNYDPPYGAKMARSLLQNVIGKSWDKDNRDWHSEPSMKLTANALLSKVCGCQEPNVLMFEESRVVYSGNHRTSLKSPKNNESKHTELKSSNSHDMSNSWNPFETKSDEKSISSKKSNLSSSATSRTSARSRKSVQVEDDLSESVSISTSRSKSILEKHSAEEESSDEETEVTALNNIRDHHALKNGGKYESKGRSNAYSQAESTCVTDYESINESDTNSDEGSYEESNVESNVRSAVESYQHSRVESEVSSAAAISSYAGEEPACDMSSVAQESRRSMREDKTMLEEKLLAERQRALAERGGLVLKRKLEEHKAREEKLALEEMRIAEEKRALEARLAQERELIIQRLMEKEENKNKEEVFRYRQNEWNNKTPIMSALTNGSSFGGNINSHKSCDESTVGGAYAGMFDLQRKRSADESTIAGAYAGMFDLHQIPDDKSSVASAYAGLYDISGNGDTRSANMTHSTNKQYPTTNEDNQVMYSKSKSTLPITRVDSVSNRDVSPARSLVPSAVHSAVPSTFSLSSIKKKAIEEEVRKAIEKARNSKTPDTRVKDQPLANPGDIASEIPIVSSLSHAMDKMDNEKPNQLSISLVPKNIANPSPAGSAISSLSRGTESSMPPQNLAQPVNNPDVVSGESSRPVSPERSGSPSQSTSYQSSAGTNSDEVKSSSPTRTTLSAMSRSSRRSARSSTQEVSNISLLQEAKEKEKRKERNKSVSSNSSSLAQSPSPARSSTSLVSSNFAPAFGNVKTQALAWTPLDERSTASASIQEMRGQFKNEFSVNQVRSNFYTLGPSQRPVPKLSIQTNLDDSFGSLTFGNEIGNLNDSLALSQDSQDGKENAPRPKSLAERAIAKVIKARSPAIEEPIEQLKTDPLLPYKGEAARESRQKRRERRDGRVSKERLIEQVVAQMEQPNQKKDGLRNIDNNVQRHDLQASRKFVEEKKQVRNFKYTPSQREKLTFNSTIPSPQNSLAYSVDDSTVFSGTPDLLSCVTRSEHDGESIKNKYAFNGMSKKSSLNIKNDERQLAILASTSSASSVEEIPSDEELFAIGWAKALDPSSGVYYYFTLDRANTVWENPLATSP